MSTTYGNKCYKGKAVGGAREKQLAVCFSVFFCEKPQKKKEPVKTGVNGISLLNKEQHNDKLRRQHVSVLQKLQKVQ